MEDNNPITVEMVGIKDAREELLIKLWWNAAIEECIKVANKYDSYGPAYEMRSLKK